MVCVRCQSDIAETVNYCPACGADQRAPIPAAPARRLTRHPSEGKLAGVCAGIAAYFELDVTVVRLAWVILSIVPGMILGGVLAYVAAWLLMPEPAVAGAASARGPQKRLRRAATDKKIAGVCGGVAEFFEVDSTAVRLLWAILTVLPGAIVCGLLAYVLAWLVMPPPAHAVQVSTALTTQTPAA